MHVYYSLAPFPCHTPPPPFLFFEPFIHCQVRIVYFISADTMSDAEVRTRLGMQGGWDEPTSGAPRIKLTGVCGGYHTMALRRKVEVARSYRRRPLLLDVHGACL